MFSRKCPYCPKILTYKTKSLFNRAEKIGRGCRSCGQSKTKILNGYKKCWNEGLTIKDPRVKKMVRHAFGKNGNRSTILMKGKTYEEIYGKKKAKQIRHKLIASRGNSWVNYNKLSIRIIDNFGKINGYNFQHAENGGEIPILTNSGNLYYLAGYDKEKTIVIEFYEKNHKTQRRIKYDMKRKKEIIKTLSCKFIELKEWEQEWKNYLL